MDAPEETRNFEYLNNQITQQLVDTQDDGGLEDED